MEASGNNKRKLSEIKIDSKDKHKRKKKDEDEENESEEVEEEESEEEESEEEAKEKKEKGKEKETKKSSFNVHPERVRTLQAPKDPAVATGVMYWMSREQRALDNWALLYAQDVALTHKVPLAVVFNLLPSYEGATIRHFGFMLKGLQTTAEILEQHGIPFFIVKGQAAENIPRVLQEYNVSHLVCDFSPMRIARKWKDDILKATDAAVYEVDAHNIVPVWSASPKQETAARTIRPKIHARIPEFLHEYPPLTKMNEVEGYDSIISDWRKQMGTIDWDAIWAFVREHVDQSVPEVDWIRPGELNAKKKLSEFIQKKLSKYATDRNNPNADAQSNLSPYFHYGNLSPQRAILEAKKASTSSKAGYDAFFEETVIRRELSDNFCYYNQNYDSFEGFPAWAKESLTLHSKDKRDHLYTYDQWEAAQTHDELWNAAQLQMVNKGKMHGFMRMYWAKKILEWSSSPQEAMQIAVKLNDRYELDGRDPNGYVGCAWSIGGVHDQGWAERAVFGKVRYMNYAGCKRKFDVASYIQKHAKGAMQKFLKK